MFGKAHGEAGVVVEVLAQDEQEEWAELELFEHTAQR